MEVMVRGVRGCGEVGNPGVALHIGQVIEVLLLLVRVEWW